MQKSTTTATWKKKKKKKKQQQEKKKRIRHVSQPKFPVTPLSWRWRGGRWNPSRLCDHATNCTLKDFCCSFTDVYKANRPSDGPLGLFAVRASLRSFSFPSLSFSFSLFDSLRSSLLLERPNLGWTRGTKKWRSEDEKRASERAQRARHAIPKHRSQISRYTKRPHAHVLFFNIYFPLDAGQSTRALKVK